MGFRNPRYLDVPLLTNLADYYGVEVPVTAQVVRRTLADKGRGAKVKTVIEAHLESGKQEELTETFATELRPVRLMNDVIDHLLSEGLLDDLVENPDAQLTGGAPVQLQGELIVSPVTEIGSLMARFMPLLIAQVGQGQSDFELDQAAAVQLLMGPQPESFPQVYDLDISQVEGRRFVVVADPKHLVGDVEVEDLESEVTLLGTVERLLSATTSMSLDRYLLPGMNRAMRKAFAKSSIEDLLQSFNDLPGQGVDVNSLTIHGPGAVIKPVAIY